VFKINYLIKKIAKCEKLLNFFFRFRKKMASELTRESLFNNLKKIKEIAELPRLYLINYFEGLRHEVDRDFQKKTAEAPNSQIKSKLDELWLDAIDIIDSFEDKCILKKFNLSTDIEKINELETKLTDNQEEIDLKQIQEEIENEEISLLSNLFQHKPICVNTRDESKKQVVGKLVLLEDEFISENKIEKDLKIFF